MNREKLEVGTSMKLVRKRQKEDAHFRQKKCHRKRQKVDRKHGDLKEVQVLKNY